MSLATAAASRSLVYWLLADLFLTCPDAALVERLRRDLSAGAGKDAGRLPIPLTNLASALPSDAEGVEALAVEYTRLFGAVSREYGPPPPYESLHREGTTAEDFSTVDSFYVQAGLAVADPAVPPDHLGVELRFLALLCHGEQEAWQAGRAKEARAMLEKEREFLDRHLLAWAPTYLDAIEGEATHPFYRLLAGTARRVACTDRAVIDGVLIDAG